MTTPFDFDLQDLDRPPLLVTEPPAYDEDLPPTGRWLREFSTFKHVWGITVLIFTNYLIGKRKSLKFLFHGPKWLSQKDIVN